MGSRRTKRSRCSNDLLFTGLELLRRVASLVPPPRANLMRFHGVFAPGAKLRPFLVPQAGAKPEPEEEPRKERTPRLDWAGLLRRTFALDVFACLRCGGRRSVLLYAINLGEMYVADPRFTANYDKHATGAAAYIRDAMRVFAERNLD